MKPKSTINKYVAYDSTGLYWNGESFSEYYREEAKALSEEQTLIFADNKDVTVIPARR